MIPKSLLRNLGSWCLIIVASGVTAGCSTPPPPLPNLNISLEKVDSNRPPLGANLIVSGAGFTAGSQASITVSNTNPDGTRQTQNVAVDARGRFSAPFPFLCISYSKQQADREMLVKVRDIKTGRLTEASIKADGFWACRATTMTNNG
ncbi:MAG TPA: hypothetical protein VJ692_03695 [Nitrospiraceae bacterium]|nr:hypothetical protein [Nitrospiraceae bacterium]